ncbi:hypothetical protein [Photobacterium kishitanii]|uniref:Uncharacterized protein n=1 Tax=Photobacterium kishitanii TaxID=318456 RepID=A0A2T3KKX8_9GAMM|nr:hypothetical protein [Photobacterium kishitanii]PSV00362.1 hypothetical protein C9J27_04340 [Photobacterium kishitanii]
MRTDIVDVASTKHSDEYIKTLKKQLDTLANHLMLVCLDVEAIPSHQEIYGAGADKMIASIEALDETRKVAEKAIGEHFEIMIGLTE